MLEFEEEVEKKVVHRVVELKQLFDHLLEQVFASETLKMLPLIPMMVPKLKVENGVEESKVLYYEGKKSRV
jgi:hypothetical protein